MEYDFIVVYKPRKNHVVVNVLSRLFNTIKHPRILKQTTYVILFYTKLKWLNDVIMFLQTRQM
jgi:hypothetical protein